MMQNFISLRELEQLAEQKLQPSVFEFFRSGANEEITKQENIDAFKKIKLKPRVLRNVSNIDTKSKILGHEVDLPIGIAPTAMMKLAHPDGEIIPAQVAHQFNIPYTLTTLATVSQEEVAKNNQSGLRFQQLYISKDRILTEKLVKRCEQEGFSALVLTVDVPVLGKRESDEKHRLMLPNEVKLDILEALVEDANITIQAIANSKSLGLMKFFAEQLDSTITWNDIKWLRSLTNLPIILKGIMCEEDAKLAVQYGINAIWISNHGGRQLDTVQATIEILPEIVKAVDGKLEIYVDGGVRSGTDIYKCLALGATHVFIGRPVIYSIGLNGKQGLEKMFKILQNELITTMQLMGVTSIKEITQEGIVLK